MLTVDAKRARGYLSDRDRRSRGPVHETVESLTALARTVRRTGVETVYRAKLGHIGALRVVSREPRSWRFKLLGVFGGRTLLQTVAVHNGHQRSTDRRQPPSLCQVCR